MPETLIWLSESSAYRMTSELTLLQKPTDESAAIDALSGDFDTSANAPATPQHSKVGHLLLITCKINSFPLLSKSFICRSSGLELSSLECAVKI